MTNFAIDFMGQRQNTAGPVKRGV